MAGRMMVRFLGALLGAGLVCGVAEGHSMKQVRAELSVGKGTWNGSIWLEAWALYPEDGPKIPPGTPGDPHTAGAAWVATLGANDHRGMREVAAEFLTETFQLALDGRRLKADYAFPDYAAEGSVKLAENASGNALVRIDLNGTWPAENSGPLTLVWNDDEDEPLALELKLPGRSDSMLKRISPKQPPLELANIGTDGKVDALSNETSLLTWIDAGFHHILPLGMDHICFILGLFLLQPKVRPLLWQTSAFTLAHSITLALVVLGVITAPSSIVEPMIALSIAYVGIENLWVKELKPWRVGLVFGLGLLHGMGFASVMQELDLPQGQVIKPLIGFNLGVELGQISVLAIAFTVSVWFITHHRFATFRKVASALIGMIGLYWTYERIFL